MKCLSKDYFTKQYVDFYGLGLQAKSDMKAYRELQKKLNVRGAYLQKENKKAA